MIYYKEVQSQIAPWGEHEANGNIEVFERESLERVLRSQQGQRILVFKGFPKAAYKLAQARARKDPNESTFTEMHQDQRIHGIVKKMLLTNFGLECIIGLNKLGIEAVKQDKLCTADFGRFTPMSWRRFKFTRLYCIGLTNNPTMPIAPIVI